MHWLTSAAAIPLLVLGIACTPVEYETARYSGAAWPASDQPTSNAQKLEIETLLARLGYFRGTVDGAITADTRTAAARYQRAIGAPANGFISPVLLAALRSSVGTTPAPRPRAPTPAAVNGGGGSGGGGGGGDGGGGGGGGGPWG